MVTNIFSHLLNTLEEIHLLLCHQVVFGLYLQNTKGGPVSNTFLFFKAQALYKTPVSTDHFFCVSRLNELCITPV